ncbi:MAG: hypothetical protein ACI9PY_001100 [Ascidiaceihabitans sp.]|jgi:hypothetical protein
MQNDAQDLKAAKDMTRHRCTPRPDRSEIADVAHQFGAADGFSLEWIVDRFPHQNRGHV